MKKLLDEYQARVIDDSGIVRSRVPSPLLQRMGARPGDLVAFRPRGSTATMRVTRAKVKGKAKRKKR